MSKGNPIVATRISKELKAQLDERVEELFMNGRTKSREWHKAEFIRIAIIEKLLKSRRSGGEKMKGRGGVSTATAGARHEETINCTTERVVIQGQSEPSADPPE